jgi:hypothetical protein
VNNTPMWVGEWALSTQFNATDDFLKKWADAQKLAYSQGAGWLVRSFYLRDQIGCIYPTSQFWSFKLEATNPLVTQW